jgi:hypothetical protein
MFELHVVVAGIVMFNIMELIMEIVPNSPTGLAISFNLVFWAEGIVFFFTYKDGASGFLTYHGSLFYS